MRVERILLLAWALAATLLAALWAPRGTPPPPRASAAAEIPRLRLRIAELEQALAGVVPPSPADGTPPRVEDLFAGAKSVALDPEATVGARQAADRALYALLARDATAHQALARMLPGADEETCDLLLAALVLNPFVKAVWKRDVTEEILSIAAACLKAEQPHVRAAAATLLLGYVPAEPASVRLALDALAAETVPEVRDAMLAAVADGARGVALTEADAAPLVAELRARVAAGEPAWASSLADWSGSEDDYGDAQALFLAQTETGARQQCLNAFRREARLVEGQVEDAEAFLRDAMLDPSLDDLTRGLARHFLDGYAPWGERTADAVRRYEEER